jgi:hypothetical protein
MATVLPQNETEPKPRVPPDYAKAGFPYQVKDGESWKSIAAVHELDVKYLIRFNFKTNVPEEVNWYLRHYVGCDQTTPDQHNYIFSSSAKPGIIYVPARKANMAPKAITGMKTTSPLALEFEGPDSPLDALGKFFDVFSFVSTLSSVFVTSLIVEGLMIGGGIVAAPAAMFVLLGGPHEAALNEIRKGLILDGLSRGIVLTADGRSPRYIRDHGWVQMWPINNIHYPQYGKQFQGIYNRALVTGIAHGQQFNEVARRNLFRWIGAQMRGTLAATEYNGNESENWDDRKWYNYYRVCAAILQRKIVLR